MVTAGAWSMVGSWAGTGLTAVGELALFGNTTGTNNTAVGLQALNGNTTGTDNTAVGYQALLTNSTATRNTVILLASLVAIDLLIVGSWFGVEKLAQRIEQTTVEEVQSREEPAAYSFQLIRDYAASLGVELPLFEDASRLLRRAAAEGRQEQDTSAVYFSLVDASEPLEAPVG